MSNQRRVQRSAQGLLPVKERSQETELRRNYGSSNRKFWMKCCQGKKGVDNSKKEVLVNSIKCC